MIVWDSLSLLFAPERQGKQRLSPGNAILKEAGSRTGAPTGFVGRPTPDARPQERKCQNDTSVSLETADHADPPHHIHFWKGPEPFNPHHRGLSTTTLQPAVAAS